MADACFPGVSDEGSLLFCGIHIVETYSKAIEFSEKSIENNVQLSG